MGSSPALNAVDKKNASKENSARMKIECVLVCLKQSEDLMAAVHCVLIKELRHNSVYYTSSLIFFYFSLAEPLLLMRWFMFSSCQWLIVGSNHLTNIVT